MRDRAVVGFPVGQGDQAVSLSAWGDGVAFWPRGIWAIADQGLFALSNFILNLLLARWLIPQDYGAFTLAFMVFLLLGTAHTALLTEPMLVFGPGRYRTDLGRYLGALLLEHVRFSAAAGILLMCGALVAARYQSPALAASLAGFALAGPLVLLVWLGRRVCYMLGAPSLAALGGALHLVLVLVGSGTLYARGLLSIWSALGVLGLAGLIAAGALIAGMGVPRRRSDQAFRRGVREGHLQYGRWAMVAAALAWIAGSLPYVLLPIWEGIEATAALRALAVLLMPFANTVTAISVLLVPQLVRVRGSSGFDRAVRRGMVLLVCAALLYGTVLSIPHRPIIHWVYGGRYDGFAHLVPMLAMILVPLAASALFIAALKAMERPELVFRAHAAGAAGVAALAVPAIRYAGVGGAAVSLVLGSALTAAVAWRMLSALRGSTSPLTSRDRAPVGEINGAPAAGPGSVGRGLSGLFRVLNETGVRYCVLHDWESLPGNPRSDVDIVVAPEHLAGIESALRSGVAGLPVQLFHHTARSYYFVQAIRGESGILFLPVDVTLDYRAHGIVLLSGERLLEDRRYVNGMWVAAPEAEFSYLLAKKLVKGAFPDHQKARIRELAVALGGKSQEISMDLLGQKGGMRFADLLSQGDWEALRTALPALRRALLWRGVRRDPLSCLPALVHEVQRVWERLRKPSGLSIAIIGPDGSGKSTLAHRLTETLRGTHRHNSAIFHLRPSITGRSGAGVPATNPHRLPVRPWWLSAPRIPYYVASHIAGHVIGVVPSVVRSGLVVFDRYYDDLLADPRRFRYGGPMRLARWAQRLVPRPDVVLVLDVPEDQVRERKQEVPLDEIRRQREAYRTLAAQSPNSVILDGSLTRERVAQDASEVIAGYLHARYLQRRHIWFGGSATSEIDWLTAALSTNTSSARLSVSSADGWGTQPQSNQGDRFLWWRLPDGRSWLIPQASRRAAASGLDLYGPQNLRGKTAKALAQTVAALHLAHIMFPTVHVLKEAREREESRAPALLLDHLRTVLGRSDLTFAIALGNPGSRRKPMIKVLTPKGRALAYAKIGWNGVTNALVRNEVSTLTALKGIPRSFVVPDILHEEEWNGRYFCLLSAPNLRATPASPGMTDAHLNAVRDLAAERTCLIPPRQSAFWHRLQGELENTPDSYHSRLLCQAVARIEERFGDQPLPFHPSHGDFTPWNVHVLGRELYLLDWEDADASAPAAYDLFHYEIQARWLLGGQAPYRIYRALRPDGYEGGSFRGYLSAVGIERGMWTPLLALYLIRRLVPQALARPSGLWRLRPLETMLHLCMHDLIQDQ